MAGANQPGRFPGPPVTTALGQAELRQRDESIAALYPTDPAPSRDPFDHERRFLLSGAEETHFLDAIAPYAAFEIYNATKPISYTRTTYFDTDDLSYCRAPRGEPARRLRVREYALAATPADVPVLSGVAYVELKQNLGAARSKVRLVAPPTELADLVERHGASGGSPLGSEAFALIAGQLAIPGMAPRIATWYRRVCLTAADRRVRITLDENLTFCRPQAIGLAGVPAAPTAMDVVGVFPSRILEVKHCGEMPAWLYGALADLRGVPQFSKFRVGMQALGHDIEPPSERATDDGLLSPLFTLQSFVAA